MDTPDIAPLLEQLDDNIDDLEEALAPLIKGALSDTAAKLPLLDKAKLYVLVTYAIESILFCWYHFHTFVFRLAYFGSVSSVEWCQRKRSPSLSRID